MFIELIDSLRCTRPHANTWLVASIAARDDRIVTTGVLGCPLCSREYPIEQGIAWFGLDPAPVDDAATVRDDAADDAMLLGALLSATEGAVIAVTGTWAAAAVALGELVPMRVFVVNPDRSQAETENVAIVRSAEGIPLAPGAARGIALDAANVSARDVESAVHVLAPGGRLTAPSTTPVPLGVVEVARDERWWVAEKVGPLTQLHRH